MGKLTTHVLDTARGVPGKLISVKLFFNAPNQQQLVASAITNEDGRCDQPLLEGNNLLAGEYVLEFDIGSYYQQSSFVTETQPFLNKVLVQFYVSNANEHYHVPLLVTPWSYSTYRGS